MGPIEVPFHAPPGLSHVIDPSTGEVRPEIPGLTTSRPEDARWVSVHVPHEILEISCRLSGLEAVPLHVTSRQKSVQRPVLRLNRNWPQGTRSTPRDDASAAARAAA